jgi:hypothetical protein
MEVVVGEHPAERYPPLESGHLLAKVVIVLAAFGVGVGLAELFGAKNLGTALGVGQLTFVVGLIYVLMRRNGRSRPEDPSEGSD